MNIIKYSQKLPVYVSAGVFIAGSIWFARMDRNVLGEDVAELRSAVEERKLAMQVDFHLTGPVDPFDEVQFWYDGISWVPVPTWFGTNRVWVEIIENTSGGGVTVSNGLVNTPLIFTDANYSDNQTVYFTVATNARAGSYVEAAVYVDGVMQTGRMIAVVGKAPPGGESGSASIGDVTLGWTRKRFEKGATYEQTIRLDAAPREMESQIIVTDHTSKAQFYSNIMYAAKMLTTTNDGGNLPQGYDVLPGSGGNYRGVPRVMWLANDVTNGDVLCSIKGGTWVDRTQNNWRWAWKDNAATIGDDLVQTTSTRTPGSVAYADGFSKTNAPFSRTLYSGWFPNISAPPTYKGVTRTAAAGLVDWWSAIGNGGNAYLYACESNAAHVSDAIALTDLDQTANVLTNMKRTIAFLPRSALTNVVITKTSRLSQTNYPVRSSASPDSQVAQKWADGFTLASGSVVSSVTSTNAVEWRSVGLLVEYEHAAKSYQSLLAGGTVYNIAESHKCKIVTREISGDLYGYPSAAAVSNGMVARVRVFVLHDNWCAMTIGLETVGTNNITAADGDYTPINLAMRSGFVAGMNAAPNALIDSVLPLNGPLNRSSKFDILTPPVASGDEFYLFPLTLQYTLRQVAEVTNVTQTGISVSFGADNIADADIYAWEKFTRENSGAFTREIIEGRSAHANVAINCFVVVVDWNFSHLGETAYEPTPYTPEWLSTNTP